MEDMASLPYFNDIEMSRDFKCYRDGILIDHNELGLNCDIEVLTLMAFQYCHIPPVYWRMLVANFVDNERTPESGILVPKEPIESLEYRNYYIVPYFSNYVINRRGMLIKKSTGVFIQASKAATGYFTYRMTDDSNKTGNCLRHRILAITFHKYGVDVNTLDVNHLNGVPGSDDLDNIEWASRTRNIIHAYETGLRSDNIPVQIREVNLDKTYLFRSLSEAGDFLNITHNTVKNRIEKGPEIVYDGFQYRYHPATEPWPDVKNINIGKYLISVNNELKRCNAKEAARHMGLTRTSFLRAVRENRWVGKNSSKLINIYESPTGE